MRTTALAPVSNSSGIALPLTVGGDGEMAVEAAPEGGGAVCRNRRWRVVGDELAHDAGRDVA